MMGSNSSHSDIMDTPFGVILEIIVLIGILFLLFGLPQIISGSSGNIEPYYDDSSELKVQDEKASSDFYDEERKRQAQENQDEYDDYMEWVQEGRP